MSWLNIYYTNNRVEHKVTMSWLIAAAFGALLPPPLAAIKERKENIYIWGAYGAHFRGAKGK